MTATKKPAAAAKPNFNLATELLGVRHDAAALSGAREALARRIAFIVSHGASEGIVKDLQREMMIGYIAGKIGLGQRGATEADYVEAALIYKRAGAGADKPNTFGKRTVEQEAWYGAARVLWHDSKTRAGLGKNEARSEAAKKNAANRAPRAGTSVQKGATKVAKGSKVNPAPQPATGFANKSEAIAGAMQYAQAIKTLAEANAKHLGKALTKTLNDAAGMILSLPM